MKLSRNMIIIISSSFAIIIGLSIFLAFILSPGNSSPTTVFDDHDLIEGTSATHLITSAITTAFSTFSPLTLEYSPTIVPTTIGSNLNNIESLNSFQALNQITG